MHSGGGVSKTNFAASIEMATLFLVVVIVSGVVFVLSIFLCQAISEKR